MKTKKGIRDIYLASGLVFVELTKATKTKPGHWIEKKFENVLTSGFSQQEAKAKLTPKKIFVSKEHKWLQKKKVQIIKVELKFLNKSMYY